MKDTVNRNSTRFKSDKKNVHDTVFSLIKLSILKVSFVWSFSFKETYVTHDNTPI